MIIKERRVNRGQRGSVLVEFSLIAVSLSLLIALVVDVARMVFIAQVLQETARVAARELSLVPLSPAITFEQALQHPRVKRRIYDPAALVIEMDQFEDLEHLEEFMTALPIVNRMLRPLMVREWIRHDGHRQEVLRFPGVLMQEDTDKAEQSWSIAVPGTGMTGLLNASTVKWMSVLEEIRENPDDPRSGSFSLHGAQHGSLSGLIALRVNYPLRLMFMNWLPLSALPESVAILSVAEPGAHANVQLPTDDTSSGNEITRFISKKIVADSSMDYHQVLSAQAVFRREIFQ